jgi:hypothetical protein
VYFDNLEEAMSDAFLSPNQQGVDADKVCSHVEEALYICDKTIHDFVRDRVGQLLEEDIVIADEALPSQVVQQFGYSLRNNWENIAEQLVQDSLQEQLKSDDLSSHVLRLLYVAR